MNLADHEMGLELQLIELVEQHERAVVQHRDTDARRIEREIEVLQAELAATVERMVMLGERADGQVEEPLMRRTAA